MNTKTNRALLYAGPVLEMTPWVVAAGVFLYAYVSQFQGPSSAIWPHLKIIGCIALGLSLMRPLAARAGRIYEGLLFPLACTGLLLSLVAYYAILLVGLSSWGRVATLPLLRVYAAQWQELATVLDVPVWSVFANGLGVLLVGFLALRWTHLRLRWAQRVASSTSALTCGLLALTGVVVAGLPVYEAVEGVDLRSGEPLMIAFNPRAVGPAAQTSFSEGARELDHREGAAAQAYRPDGSSRKRNVVLIVGDALRADRMNLFGHQRRTTPFLEKLHREGHLDLVTRAQAVCAESYCGLMAIARSKFVHEFSRASITLTRVLALHGYRVGFILGGDHTNFYGLAEALGAADFYWDGSESRDYVNDDKAVVERARALPRWDGRPTYIQFHLMSSHGLGLREEENQVFAPSRNYYRKLPTTADLETRREWARNYYDNGLLQMDRSIEALLAALEDRGYLEDAIVVVTGDHGEMLGEHDTFSHAHRVFRPVLEVPLLLWRIGYHGEPIKPSGLVSQVDVAPTVLHELGIVPPASWSGHALQATGVRDFVHFQQGREVGLFDLRAPAQPWKYWTDTISGEEFAFNPDLDPEEHHNLINSVPAELRSEWMRRLLPAANVVREIPAP